jgi:hypothetical protein
VVDITEIDDKKQFRGWTPKQREWLLRRDNHECQFILLDVKEPRKCCQKKELHAHHIKPRHWAYERLGWTPEEVNSPENGIILCAMHHVGLVHYDYGVMAKYMYRYNDQSYRVIATWHTALLKQGVEYWWKMWDNTFKIIARTRTRDYLYSQKDLPLDKQDVWPDKEVKVSAKKPKELKKS